MFDNLRRQADSSPFFEEDLPPREEQAAETPAGKSGYFLGLSPVQRFVLALMPFLNVCVLGCFCLLAFERIQLPFF